MNDKINEAVIRIKKMESLFDALSAARNRPLTKELKNAYSELSEYLASGDWQSDYELDEKKLLPSPLELKRGVLSQDGLYELLCELKDEARA